MSQNSLGTINPDTVSGTALSTLLNNWQAALHSGHGGASRPSYAVAGMTWVKTVSSTAHEVYYYDGTDDILQHTINPTANTITLPAVIMGGPITGGQAATFGAVVASTLNGFATSQSGAASSIVVTDASGNVLVNTASVLSAAKLSVAFAGATENGITLKTTYASTGSSYHVFQNSSGSVIGSITQDGASSVAYNTTSDYRLKTNVRPADAASFNQIKFRDFEWTDGRHGCGVIAHELQAIYPYLVLGDKDATEIRTVEVTPAVPAVIEKRLVSAATPAEFTTVMCDEVVLIDGVETTISRKALVETQAAVDAIYEDVEVVPAIPAVTEDQLFPVYQQVNYIGLICRMGAKIQQLEARLAVLEAG